MATIRLRADQVRPSKKAAAYDGDRNTASRTPFAAYNAKEQSSNSTSAPGMYPRTVERYKAFMET